MAGGEAPTPRRSPRNANKRKSTESAPGSASQKEGSVGGGDRLPASRRRVVKKPDRSIDRATTPL
eukprot:30845-Pelagococcus_subviridis.AAC.12